VAGAEEVVAAGSSGPSEQGSTGLQNLRSVGSGTGLMFCGSGAGSNWYPMFLSLLDPDPIITSCGYGTGSFYYQAKICLKSLILAVFSFLTFLRLFIFVK
jgi:hypothetical protein